MRVSRDQKFSEIMNMPVRMKHSVWLLLCLGLAMPALSQAAAEPRYTFGEISYIHADYDNIDESGDGLGFGGSLAIHRNVHLLADYKDISLDGDNDASALSIGAGINYPLRSGLDVVGRLSYISAEIDRWGDDSEDGYGLEAGLRMMINPQLELNGAIRYVDVFDDNTSLVLGGLYDVIPNLALGGELEFSDDYSALFLKARYYFGSPVQMH